MRVFKIVAFLLVLSGLMLFTATAQAPLVRLAIPTTERALTPYTYNTGFPGWYLLMLVYDALMVTDLDGVPRPWLAESVRVSPDGTVWTLTLRPNIRWHDGQPFTSADVKFSYELYQRVTHPRFSGPLRGVTVETPDARTVVLRLSAPSPIFDLTLADTPIVPKHIWEKAPDPKTFESPVGTGPYKLVQIVPDQFYRLEANADYFAGKPAVQALVLPIIRDATATFTALQAGQIDAATRTLTPELVAQFQGRPDIKVLSGPGFVSTLLLFNNERAPFTDPRVRRVIAGAIDFNELVRTILLGLGTVGSPGFIHPSSPWYNQALQSYARLTPEQANRALDELGYKDTNGDGVRESSDGKPLRFELLTRSGDPVRIRAAELIAQAVKPLGIVFDVRALDSDTVAQRVWPDFDACKGRNYDLAIWGWSAPVMTQANVRGLFHSDCKLGTLNVVGYANKTLDGLLDRQAQTANREERKRLLDEIQKIVADDAPFLTLFYPDLIFAVRPAAYDGWAFLKGEGIIHKLSFVKR
ncbi:MAG: ABC transporter substrate-binding protein [Candidatus Bipolaricaulota bacterium]|nr:ABC transporter substrate-binding protein [Candidatus Bipolaricaulota bacterium]